MSEPVRPSAFLEAHDALLLLRSRSLSVGLIRRIAATPEYVRHDRVRAALVLHPRTPRPIAIGLLPQLRWLDLLKATTTPSLPAPIALLAERLLTQRLAEMALGEKITLARNASEGVVRALRKESSPLLLRALLDNPRFRAEDALDLAEREDTPAAFLRLLAECPRFRDRVDLRRALAGHPSTPPQVALRLVLTMDGPELQRLLQHPSAPPLIRVASERRLAGDQYKEGPGSPVFTS
ncbi:MAG TPA: hypothetical protein VGS03_01665 [Candidatus Polarisedimenticolia bacterium]|nr:hypothetical protein [Candidatus Polarisedimenticolia bacterium]